MWGDCAAVVGACRVELMSAAVCPSCGTQFNSMRLYREQEIAKELGVSRYTVARWMNSGGLIFRVWYLGHGRVRRVVQGARLIEFLDGKIPEFSRDSEHIACRVYKWRYDSGVNAQAAMIRARRLRKLEQEATVSEPSTGYGEQRSAIIDPSSSIIEPCPPIKDP